MLNDEKSSKFTPDRLYLDMTLSNKKKTFGSISAQRERRGFFSNNRMLYQLDVDVSCMEQKSCTAVF